MCGIAGYIQRATSDPRLIEAMLDRIAHRGPDASGIWRERSPGGEWEVVLGHRRLSIIDIEASAQPMGDAAGSCHITYNGEVYNFPFLRSRLQSSGHTFRTSGDTEVVLQHLGRTGERGLAELNGMFALGLWDTHQRSLLLARDRAGIKPLYWARLPCGGIAFASELLALVCHPDVCRDVDPSAVAEFLFRDYVLPPRTILKNVHKLRPGQWLRWNAADQRAVTDHFWSPQPTDLNAKVDPEHLDDLIKDAVRSQLVADVPLGVFLSGGLDSSLVAAVATVAARVPVSTFSLGFEDGSFDESASAAVVARHLNSRHHTRRVTDTILLDSLDDALGALDEPMGDHSIVPTYLLSALAAQHVKVVLGGDGADELFGGYPTYLAHRVADGYAATPSVARRAIASLVSGLPSSHQYQGLSWKLKRFFTRWDAHRGARHQRWMSSTDLPSLATMMGGPQAGLLADEKIESLEAVMRFDFGTYLPGSVLTKVDRASMAHGLEVRPPYLDNAIIDFALRLPASAKVRGRTTKWLLKRVAERWLPRNIVYRKKHGFSVPLARWIAGPLRDHVESAITETACWVNPHVATAMLAEHVAMRQDHSKTLWSLIVLANWHRRLQQCTFGDTAYHSSNALTRC